jgi:hypothetical protein
MLRLLLIFLPVMAFSQQSVYDDFSDGNFNANPRWYGDSNLFTVDSQYQLALADTIANNAVLATSSQIALEAQWELEFSFQFNPSASNFARFYLLYNRSGLDGYGQGYFLEMGGSSSDQISLCKANGNQQTVLATSPINLLDQNFNHFAVRVRRDLLHHWYLELDTLLNGSFFLLASAQDSSFVQSQIMAWQCQYTRTRSDKIFLHKVSVQGDIYRDTVAPIIDSVLVEDTNLSIYFSEPIDSAQSLHLQNFSIDSLIQPSLIKLDSLSKRKLSLFFSQPLVENQWMKLYYRAIYDLAQNSGAGEVELLNYQAESGHLLVSEIMIDPSPPVALPPDALPESEYVEIFNNSSFPLNFRNWRLRINEKDFLLPAYELLPDSFLVLVSHAKLQDFQAITASLGVGLSSFSLLNDGAAVLLLSPDSVIIDALEYDVSWYAEPLKSDGGWSLERSKNDFYCRGVNQWHASNAPLGGTPGKVNSANTLAADSGAPKLEQIGWEEPILTLKFNESIGIAKELVMQSIQIQPSLVIDSISWSYNQDRLELHLAQAPQYGQEYALSILDSLKDCSDNASLISNKAFALPVDAQVAEVLVSEILFAPKSGGSDFIELYNASNKVFDLSHLLVSRWNNDLGAYDAQVIKSESALFFPGEYIAISEDVSFLQANYFCDGANLLAGQVPNFSSEEGGFAILNLGLIILDHGRYSDDWHFELLEEKNGISLERIDFGQLPLSEKHWQSATQNEAYATPGRLNSQQTITLEEAEWEAIPPYFSPNGDGYSDYAQLYFSYEGGSSMAKVDIFTVRGERVRSLVEYNFSAEQGYFLWDGFDNEGQLLAAGIYIAILEYYNDQGYSDKLRTPIVLSR